MRGKYPRHGILGIILIGVFWYLNWHGGDMLRTHWMFFPLWFGYLLAMDGIAVLRGRPSLITGNWKNFITLFLVSIPLWWLFEWINERAMYWKYIPENAFSLRERTLWTTLCFSTVAPAVFVTSNAILSIPWFWKHHLKMRAAKTRSGRIQYLVIGILMLIALLFWPQYGMAFMWVSLYFIIDPINVIAGKPALMGHTARGDWRMVLVLFTATLVCGFFWELWNMYSWPKWIYTFPYLHRFKVFEMPLAGYLGYLPFGLEVWAITALIAPSIGRSMLPASK